jgi:hypothetical protein
MEYATDYQCDHNEEWDESHGEHCKIVTHIAGLTIKKQKEMEFSDLFDGHVIDGKTQQRVVSGGSVIRDTTYTLKF